MRLGIFFLDISVRFYSYELKHVRKYDFCNIYFPSKDKNCQWSSEMSSIGFYIRILVEVFLPDEGQCAAQTQTNRSV